MEHGIGGIGNSRVVEANVDGFNWVRVGEYVTGVQNESVDWAIVHLDDDIVASTDPPVPVIKDDAAAAKLADKVTGVGYSHQAGGQILFESTDFRRGDLNGRVGRSPTVRNQIHCVTTPGTRRANEGVSGMAVYNKAGGVLGLEWAIEWDGPNQRHTFYVEPITAVVMSLAETVSGLDDQYRKSQAPPPVWRLAKPLADCMVEDIEARRQHADREGVPDLNLPKHLFLFLQRNIV